MTVPASMLVKDLDGNDLNSLYNTPAVLDNR
jgi:hypothetical protein